MKKRSVLASFDQYQFEVLYNPQARHWYLSTYSVAVNTFPTPYGDIDLLTLTQRIKATNFFGINIDHLSSYDILFLKDESGRIAIFTMVDGSGQEFGNLYRTDKGGFCYRTAHFYFDTTSEQGRSAPQFLVTENNKGEWALVAVYHSLVGIVGIHRDFIERQLVLKGFKSETALLNYYRDSMQGPDLLNSDIFVRITPETPPEEYILK